MTPALTTLTLFALTQSGVPGASERLEATVPELLTRAHVPGASMALLDTGGVTWSAAFGLRDAEHSLPAGEDTVFAAASLSKPVFAYLVLLLVDMGMLELDRPLVDYAAIPDLAHDPRHKEITARMVLSHTAGLPNWRPAGGALEIGSDPGTAWRYSGEGYVLLARVVEELTAARLDSVAHDLVFEPLAMTSTSFRCDLKLEDFAMPHGPQGDRKARPGAQVNAAASLVTTASDYGRFLVALLRAEELSPELAREMQRPKVPEDGRARLGQGVSWGLGLGIEEQAEGPALWQWGHNNGYRAFAWLSPRAERGFVFFTNGDGGMRLLTELLTLATGCAEHPAAQHLGYESL